MSLSSPTTTFFSSVFMLTLLALLLPAMPSKTLAQDRPIVRPAGATTTAPLPASADPFVAIESEADAGRAQKVSFERTELDAKASARGEASLRGQTLLVRMRAKNMPLPTSFGVPRYALWVYVPNYQVKMYIGDLPITLTSKDRGSSDSAYRFTNLPPDAEFGGLMLTAEPVRFTPIVNEALRPLFIGLSSKESLAQAVAATTIYAGPPPTSPGERRDAQPAPGTPTTTAPSSTDRQP
ncbi:MAG TPA: hypothetical protein VM943_08800 [Pyrinomonadaceae bacterium]|nr:hypothetical protein [Pyrinomonadaceae bacterium]